VLATASLMLKNKTIITNKQEEYMANRRRTNEIKFRLADDELDVLQQRMNVVGCINREAFIRKMVLEGYILRMNFTEVREFLRLISNATSNINQIAMRANESRSIYARDVQELSNQFKLLKSEASKTMQVLRKVQAFHDQLKQ